MVPYLRPAFANPRSVDLEIVDKWSFLTSLWTRDDSSRHMLVFLISVSENRYRIGPHYQCRKFRLCSPLTGGLIKLRCRARQPYPRPTNIENTPSHIRHCCQIMYYHKTYTVFAIWKSYALCPRLIVISLFRLQKIRLHETCADSCRSPHKHFLSP